MATKHLLSGGWCLQKSGFFYCVSRFSDLYYVVDELYETSGYTVGGGSGL